MNQAQRKLVYATLLSLSTFFFVWTNLFSSSIVWSQTGLGLERIKLLASENTLPPEVKSAVLNNAVKRTSQTVSALKIIEAQQQEWSDGCLGLAKVDEICTQVITPGWRIVVTDGLRNWIYRTDNTGDAIRLEEFDGSGE
jgi:hypothetical protein